MKPISAEQLLTQLMRGIDIGEEFIPWRTLNDAVVILDNASSAASMEGDEETFNILAEVAGTLTRLYALNIERQERERGERREREERQAEEEMRRWRELFQRTKEENEVRRAESERERQERVERARQKREEKEKRWREREQRERFERELGEAAEARRNRPPVDWRLGLLKMRQLQRGEQPAAEKPKLSRAEKLRRDMELACNCHDAWTISFPYRSACPLVVKWRTCAISRFNEWSREQAQNWKAPTGQDFIANWPEPYKIRFSRRPTLSEYDNRRDADVKDRYRFGVYNGQYDR